MRPGHLFALAACALAVDRHDARACTDEPEPALGSFSVLPADGTVAPPNTWIWVPPPTGWETGDVDPNDILIRDGEKTVDAEPVAIRVDGYRGYVFRPLSRLTPGSTVTVTNKAGIVSIFTVGGVEDHEAPPRPSIARVDVEGGLYGAYSCGEFARVTIATAADAEILLLTDEALTALPSHTRAMATGHRVRGEDIDEGEQALHVTAFDVAGNSATAPVPRFTVPSQQAGCSATGAPGATPLFALAVVGLGRMRRRQREREQRKPMCENRRRGS